MNLHHAWHTFKNKRAYAALVSLYNSPLVELVIALILIALIIAIPIGFWKINYYLVANEYLPSLGSKKTSHVINTIGYCGIEIVCMFIFAILIASLYAAVEETIAKLRIDLKKYDIEAAQYVRKRRI
jgi:Na+-driven multidrug efflux pump